VANTNLLNVLVNQNKILEVICLGLVGTLTKSAIKKEEDKQNPNEPAKVEADLKAIKDSENIYKQPFTVKGRVIRDSNGLWLDPITQKFYNPLTGDRIFESDLASFKAETHPNTNIGSGSAVSADVNFKEVLKSQANINSEISKYISSISENQKNL